VPTFVIYDQIAQFGGKLNFPAESLAKLDVVLAPAWRSSTRRPEPASKTRVRDRPPGRDPQHPIPRVRPTGHGPERGRRHPLPTTVNAALLGHAGTLGVIAPAAYAGLLTVDGDPLADVEVLAGQGERLDLIVRAGEVIINRLG
jgi:hypothetical protein